jgi:hypothetical protein
MEGFATDQWCPQTLSFPVSPKRYNALLAATDEWSKQFEEATEDGMVVHRVELEDTLSGLAIRYNTTAAAIKVTNRLGFGGDLHALQSVVIPISFADASPPTTQTIAARPTIEQLCCLARAQLLKQLCTEVKCTQDEGLITLSLAGFNLKAALAEARGMAAWADVDDVTPKRVTISMPLGMSFAEGGIITKVTRGGNAEQCRRVNVGMLIVRVGTTYVQGMRKKEVAALIKRSKRVCVLELAAGPMVRGDPPPNPTMHVDGEKKEKIAGAVDHGTSSTTPELTGAQTTPAPISGRPPATAPQFDFPAAGSCGSINGDAPDVVCTSTRTGSTQLYV